MWNGLKKILYFLFLCAITLLIAYGLLLWMNQGKGEATLESLRVPLLIFRVSVMVAVIGFWPKLVDFFSKRSAEAWDSRYKAAMLKARWKLAGVFILIELVIIQDALGKLIAWWS